MSIQTKRAIFLISVWSHSSNPSLVLPSERPSIKKQHQTCFRRVLMNCCCLKLGHVFFIQCRQIQSADEKKSGSLPNSTSEMNTSNEFWGAQWGYELKIEGPPMRLSSGPLLCFGEAGPKAAATPLSYSGHSSTPSSSLTSRSSRSSPHCWFITHSWRGCTAARIRLPLKQ